MKNASAEFLSIGKGWNSVGPELDGFCGQSPFGPWAIHVLRISMLRAGALSAEVFTRPLTCAYTGEIAV